MAQTVLKDGRYGVHMNVAWRPTSFLARCGLLLLLAVAVLLTSSEAAATITVTNVNYAQGDAGAGPSYTLRPTTAEYWISFQDCIENNVLQFTVASDQAFSVAASASLDCSDGSVTSTTTGTAPYDLCYPIASSVPNGTVVSVAAHDLVKGTLGIDCMAGVTPTIPSTETFAWPVQITFYFYVPVADAASSDFTTWPAANTATGTTTTTTTTGTTEDIALVGPAPPSPIGLGVGDGVLFVDLPSTATDANTIGYYMFCYPLDGDAGTSSGDAGTATSTTSTSTASTSSGSAGTGGSGTGGASGLGGAGTGGAGGSSVAGAGGSVATGLNDCPSGTTLPEPLTYASQNICGTTLVANTSYQLQQINNTTPLMNGTTYIVAVAAYDQVFNLGSPAALQCGKPQIVDSFFNTYCAEGGPGCANGCGSCNVGSGADPLWPALGVSALAAIGIMVRRDRRRRAPRPRRSPEQE